MNKILEFENTLQLLKGLHFSEMLFIFVSYGIIHCKTHDGCEIRITDNVKRGTFYYNKKYITKYFENKRNEYIK